LVAEAEGQNNAEDDLMSDAAIAIAITFMAGDDKVSPDFSPLPV
jgi:hypothetical protein